MTGLHVPEIDPDGDVLSAALAYAEAGWYVAPTRPDDPKNPGSRLGKRWPLLSSRDPGEITSWFAGSNDRLVLHAGRSGAVGIDVDHPDQLPQVLAAAVAVAPFQQSRPDQPGRGHAVFLAPPGRRIGNGGGRLGRDWGEVRGQNGVLAVAPSRHADHDQGAAYRWLRAGPVPTLPPNIAEQLPDAAAATDAATDAQVRAFLDQYATGTATARLQGPLTRFRAAVAAGASRHESLVDVACWVAREAMAGQYPAGDAFAQLTEAFAAEATRGQGARSPEQAARESAGVVAWAVAQAQYEGPEAARERITVSRDPDTLVAPDVVRGPALPAPRTTNEEERRTPAGQSMGTNEEERSPAPAADPRMYRGLLGEIVTTVDAGQHTEADPVGVFATLLAGAGALIGPDTFVRIASTKHPLLVWPLVFGATGSGRKGEGAQTARLFLEQAADHSAIAITGLSSGEGLIERIRDVRDEDDEGGTEDKRLLVVEPEFAGVMARAKREGSTLATVLRQAWDGSDLSVLNRKALRASSSHVAVVGHVTPREFRLRSAEADMSGGTYNRFLPVFVDRARRLPLPEPIPPPVLAGLGGRFAEAIEKARCARPEIVLDEQARALWAGELYDEFAGGDEDDALWTEFVRRAAPYCYRVAALHTVLDGREQISADDLAAAASFVRYCIGSARYVLDRAPRNLPLDRIRRAIEAAPAGLTRSEVSALFSRNLRADQLDALLTELVDGGSVAQDRRATGGRPAVVYRTADGTS